MSSRFKQIVTAILIAFLTTFIALNVYAKDNDNSLNVSVADAFNIATTTLPDGTVSYPYSATVNATGGLHPYTWSAYGLPMGLSIDSSTGVISGIPAPRIGEHYQYIPLIEVTDANGMTATKQVYLFIYPNQVRIICDTSTRPTLPTGYVNTYYYAALEARYGMEPYTWSAQNLPPGLKIDPNTGVISGITAVSGELFYVTVTVSEPSGYSNSVIFRLTIEENRAPIADAGGPYEIFRGEDLFLDGSRSYDPDAAAGDSIISYKWDLNYDSFYETEGATPRIPWNTLQSLLGTIWFTDPETGVPLYNIVLQVKDTTGRVGTSITSLAIWDNTTDLLPPVTTPLLTGDVGNEGWYTSDVVVTLTAEDDINGSGVASIIYSLNGSDWLNYDSPFTIGVEGINTLQYRAIDNMGNQEAVQQRVVKIDNTPPEIKINSPVEGGVYYLNQQVTALWQTSDNISGIYSEEGTVSSGENIDTASLGEKQFAVMALDQAGHKIEQTITYSVATPAQVIENMITHSLDELQISSNVSKVILNRMDNIIKSVDKEGCTQSINKLKALSKYISAMAGKSLTKAQADSLVYVVNNIIEVINSTK